MIHVANQSAAHHLSAAQDHAQDHAHHHADHAHHHATHAHHHHAHHLAATNRVMAVTTLFGQLTTRGNESFPVTLRFKNT
jgi:hypothetical protein